VNQLRPPRRFVNTCDQFALFELNMITLAKVSAGSRMLTRYDPVQPSLCFIVFAAMRASRNNARKVTTNETMTDCIDGDAIRGSPQGQYFQEAPNYW
jgi:hypothetical protein